MYIGFAVLVVVALLVYAFRYRIWLHAAVDRSVVAVLGAMLVLLVASARSDDALERAAAPVFLAVAVDVSLSMGTRPDPTDDRGAGTRLERVQRVLLPLLAELGAAPRPVLVSVNAFTSKSETILAWDDDQSLAREIVEYVLSTGLLTEAGSDIGAALDGVVPLFDSLPATYRTTGHAKYLMLVSDGEQTISRASADVAIAKLREAGVRIISLHVGLSDPREGLPVYDDDSAFLGFEDVGGQTFSTPDPELMRGVSGEDPRGGLFIRAEEGRAVPEILEFIGVDTNRGGVDRLRVGIILVLWGLIMFGLLRWAWA